MIAAEIAKHLHGQRNGAHGWLVRCPCHEDKSPSLSIKDGNTVPLVVRCFAGCDKFDILDQFRRLGYLGPIEQAKDYVAPRYAVEPVDNERRARIAQSIWRNAAPAKGTMVETYLRSRGFDGDTPPTLRYHHALPYPGSQEKYPGMVGYVSVAPCKELVAIHRTYLLPDGSGKANVPQQKAMLGSCKGGAVRLAAAADTLIVGEGIETTLSAMQLYGLPGWAGMTASGIEGLILPEVVRHVIVCADRDEPGRVHVRGHGVESAHKAAERWRAEGREVDIRLPPGGLKDFNDLLRKNLQQPSP